MEQSPQISDNWIYEELLGDDQLSPEAQEDSRKAIEERRRPNPNWRTTPPPPKEKKLETA